MTRRATRTAALLTAATCGLTSGLLAAGQAQAADGNNGRIKNVIYLLGDGMGVTQVAATRQRYFGPEGELAMESLPVKGFVSTYSVERKSGQPGETDFKPNLVTDSASAATAWASGVKTYNAALGVDAKGNIKSTLMELAKQAGYRTGNVSTAEITDATPAGQFSHALARGCQGPTYTAAACQDLTVTGTALPTSDVRVTPIAEQIARNGTADVILGGGLSRFEADDEKALQDQGYDVLGSIAKQTVATEADLDKAKGDKVFGLFNKGNLTIEKYKRENPGSVQAQEPSVSDMTAKAIELLDNGGKGGKGFYLQVEGALIDKRSHANDAAQTLEETKAFDEAVATALAFAKKDGHTLVIVTADHECAGFNIIEKGTFTNAEANVPGTGNRDGGNPANNSANNGLADRASQSKLSTRSKGIQNAPGGTPTVDGGTPANNFAPATFATPEDGFKPEDGSSPLDGTANASLWLTYLSGNHTGADVPVFSYGAGAEQLQGRVDNTDLFDVVGNALGLL